MKKSLSILFLAVLISCKSHKSPSSTSSNSSITLINEFNCQTNVDAEVFKVLMNPPRINTTSEQYLAALNEAKLLSADIPNCRLNVQLLINDQGKPCLKSLHGSTQCISDISEFQRVMESNDWSPGKQQNRHVHYLQSINLEVKKGKFSRFELDQ